MTEDDVLFARLDEAARGHPALAMGVTRQLRRILDRKPDMTLNGLAAAACKSPAWLKMALGLDLVPNAARQVDTGMIVLANAVALAKLPEAEQELFTEDAQTLPACLFAPRANARAKQLRDEHRVGAPRPRAPQMEPRAHLRRLRELKLLLEHEHNLAIAANLSGARNLASFAAGVRYCLHLDPASVAEQQRRLDSGEYPKTQKG